MKKRIYRAINVKEVDVEKIVLEMSGTRAVVGVDVAKEVMFAAISDKRRKVHCTVKWHHPGQTGLFIEKLEELRGYGAEVEVAMEPSGTYGDALRVGLWDACLPVWRVSPKRSHDAAEVHDGVPSLHDAKSSAIVAKLHLDEASEPWPIKSEEERTLVAALQALKVYQGQFQRNKNRIENLLARHWPGVTELLELDSATLLELLAAYGSPQAVVSNERQARKLMRRVGGRFLKGEKIEAVIDNAKHTIGMKLVEEERRLVMEIAREARRNQRESQKARRNVERLTEHHPSTEVMSEAIGKTTAAVMVAAVGDPLGYDNATAYLKATGLNLKEHSSGKNKKGGLHISKRGPGVARMFLYLAVLRLIRSNAVVRAWYAKKVARQGGKMKSKAVVAIMRKLVKALWYVARGSRFDATKLFDVRRLNLSEHVAVTVLGH